MTTLCVEVAEGTKQGRSFPTMCEARAFIAQNPGMWTIYMWEIDSQGEMHCKEVG